MSLTVATLKTIYTADNSDFLQKTEQTAATLTNATNQMGAGVAGFGQKLKSLGAGMTQLGQTWTVATAPITAALGISIKKFGSFEAAMANANSITGATGDEAQYLNDRILEIGENARQGPQAAAEAYYQIVSGVQDATAHMAILETSLAVSEAGAANLEGTVGALVGSMNAYGASAADASIYGDIMTATVQKGVLTMDELGSALPNVTANAASMGIGFDEVNAALARITQSGTSASVASTQMRQAMVELQKPGADLEKVIKSLGFTSGQALVDQYGFVGALEAIATEADSAGLSVTQVFSSVEAGTAALLLGNEAAMQFVNGMTSISGAASEATKNTATMAATIINDMSAKLGKFDIVPQIGIDTINATADAYDNARNGLGNILQNVGIVDASIKFGGSAAFEGSTDMAGAIQSDTMTADIERLMASVDGLSIRIGEALAPAISDLATKATELVGKISEWVTANPELSSQLIMIAGAVVLLGPAMMILGGVVTAAGTAFTILGGAIALLTSPIFLIIALGIALGGMFYKVMNDAGGLSNLLKNTLTTALQLVAIPVLLVGAGLKMMLDFIGGLLTKIPGLGGLFQAAFDGVEGIVSGVASAVGGIADAVSKLAAGLGSLLGLSGSSDPIAANVGGASGVNMTTASSTWQASSPVTNVNEPSRPMIGGMRKATGGMITGGQTITVGERGPELFTPERNGLLISNDKMSRIGGGGGQAIVLNNPTFNGVTDIQMLYDLLQREAQNR